jgi:hypothetical protein
MKRFEIPLGLMSNFLALKVTDEWQTHSSRSQPRTKSESTEKTETKELLTPLPLRSPVQISGRAT